MKRLFILACFLELSLAIVAPNFGGWDGGWDGGWNGGWGSFVVSKRDGAGPSDICQSVQNLLDQARARITADDLGIAAAQIQAVADAYLDAQGGDVPAQDIQALINELAKSLNVESTVSALFGDPLTYSADIIKAALIILNGLCERVDNEQAAGETSIATVAAISMTTKAIQGIVSNTVAVVTFALNNQLDGNPAKRWELRKRDEGKKTGWSAGVDGGYSSGGDWKVGGHISYSWRRR